MLKQTVLSGLAALAIATGLSFAAPSIANAGGVTIELGYSSGSPSLSANHRSHRRDGSIRHYEQRRHYEPRRHEICHPGKAVYKAEDRGVRRARIDRVGDRFVIVEGRKHGSRVKVAFYRDSPRCEIAWVKRDRHHGYRDGYRF